MIFNLIIFFISFFASYFLLKKIIPFLSLDMPNARSSHSNPIYRGGGIAFIIICFVTIPLTKYYSLFLLLPLIAIGYLDDLYSLRSLFRYAIQLLTVSLVINFNFNLPLNPQILFLIVLVFGTGIINFTNFIDGIDGLLASNMIIILTHLTILNGNENLYPLIGGLLAFFFLNKSPAKVFMGDVGSTFLGAILFMEIIKVSDYKLAFLSLAVASPIYLDAFFCVIARFINSENIFLSHKKHLYQRLVSNGFSHSKVTTLYSLSSGLICLTCYTYNITFVIFMITLIFIVGLILNKYFASPFIELND
jgi:UDP-N-acetylmuramyl pentapeptide phosphotransferase/UDP-N-acetylglucosamine-1-phosphate transferase